MSRLIDADALKESLKLPEESGRMGELLGMVIDAVIEDAPTIEERKTGKWIPHPNKEFREWDVCTACGQGCKRREYGTYDGKEYVTEFNYLYCPNCGADVRGEA